MKTKLQRRSLAMPALFLAMLIDPLATARAQGTTFTYQGQLRESANPASGKYDLRFVLYDALTGGTPQGGALTNTAITVSNGLFTVMLDFGNQFPGADRWLEIGVRTNGGSSFTTLSPRQPLTPTPYAIRASNAATATTAATASAVVNNAIGSAQLQAGAVDSAALADGSIVAADLSVAVATNTFWRLDGNPGTTAGTHFMGTTDNQPLELRVNNTRVLRVENNIYGAPNLLGGAAVNVISPGVSGAVIAGGGAASYLGFGPETNTVAADYSSIGGGWRNTILAGSSESIIAGGQGSIVYPGAVASTIAGGANHRINAEIRNSSSGTGSGYGNAIGGGLGNFVLTNSVASVVGGGLNNTIGTNATTATIPGGQNNYAASQAFAAGTRAKANHTGAFVWADASLADFASSGDNQFLIRASGGVGIGETAPDAPLHVKEGSAGSVTPSASSIAVFERNSHAYVTILTPTNGESGVLFGSPTSSVDGGVLYNGNSPRGLEFRTGGNNVKMVIESAGNVGIGTTNPTNKLHVIGGATFASGSAGANQTVVWSPGNGSWSFTSDRAAKDRVSPVDAQSVLEKVVRLPISEWSYIGYAQRHIGPMAQDFHTQFPLNENDKALNDADLHGVALAAIQGLNQKVEAQRAELARKQSEITALHRRLERLELLLTKN